MTMVQEGPIILIGYEYHLRLQAEADLFPIGAIFTGHLRRAAGESAILTIVSSANGGVLRRDARTLEIVLASEVTKTLTQGSVVLDIVRTDVDPDQHLGVLLEIPVALPVTRDL